MVSLLGDITSRSRNAIGLMTVSLRRDGNEALIGKFDVAKTGQSIRKRPV